MRRTAINGGLGVRRAALTTIGSIGLLASCPFMGDPPLSETIDGPEAVELRADVDGTLLYHTHGEQFFALDLSSGFRREWTLDGRIWGMDGPDRLGRCVYAVHRGDRVDLVLHDLRSDETRVITSQRGSETNWYMHAFRSLALSPNGDLVAFSRERDGNRWPERSELGSGLIQVWSTAGEMISEIDANGYSSEMHWHPDGSRFTTSLRYPKSELPTGLVAVDNDSIFQAVVCHYDLNSESWKPLFNGHCLGYSPAGSFMLVQSGDEFAVHDMATSTSRSIAAPGIKWPIALLEDGVVLYAGLPTTGAEQGVLKTLQKNPQRMWTVKLGELDSARFSTVLSEVARFHVYRVGSEL